MSMHHLAYCTTCRWATSKPDAHRAARRHEIQHMFTPAPHRTVRLGHPRMFCTPECRAEKEPK